MDKYVALVPARGGSKGIRHKNIVDVAGRPLLFHVLSAAKRCSQINRVFVSSEDPDILTLARDYKVGVVERPVELAQDNTPTEAVIEHFLHGRKCVNVVLIQPTSPLLSPQDLNVGITKFEQGEYDSMFSAVRSNDILVWEENPLFPVNYDPAHRGRRQTRKDGYILIETGAFFIFSRKMFSEYGCRLGGRVGYCEMPFWRSFQVDTPEDLRCIQVLMNMKK